MQSLSYNQNTSKNRWGSSLIDKHYKNQHDIKWGSRHSYGSSLYDCPCCCGLSAWKKSKKKNIRNDSKIQMFNSLNDSEFTNMCVTNEDAFEYIPKWKCSQCTYINLDSTPFCFICNKAFDYNHKNNQNNLNQPLIIQYKSKKKKKKKKITKPKNVQHRTIPKQTKTNWLSTDQIYIDEAEKYRQCKRNKPKQNSNNTKRKKKLKKECFELFDIEISVIASKYNEYEYIEHKLFYDFYNCSFWINVPMKLMNTQLQQCSIKIIPKNKQNTKCVHFQPIKNNFFVPIYMTKYSFIYRHDPIPQILQHDSLFRMIRHCLDQCCVKNINFNYDISIHQWNLCQTLIDYIPAFDILKNVLFPLIGYNESLCIQTKVKNANIDKTVFQRQTNEEMNPIDDKYKSRLNYVIYTFPKQRKPMHMSTDKNYIESVSSSSTVLKLFGDEFDSSSASDSSASIPIFLKYLNGYTDDDTDSVLQPNKTLTNNIPVVQNTKRNVFFKQPYKYCQHSSLLDNDPEREEKWWQHVRYTTKYKGYDKVEVSKSSGNCDIWKKATVMRVVSNGIYVRYDDGWRYRPHEFISKGEYESKLRRCAGLTCKSAKSNVDHDKLKHVNYNNRKQERKRKAYSKSNANYFPLNGR